MKASEGGVCLVGLAILRGNAVGQGGSKSGKDKENPLSFYSVSVGVGRGPE